MDYTRFQWRNVEPSPANPPVWQRDIDECENFYTALARQWQASGRSFFHITGHLALRINLPAAESGDADIIVDDALARAWSALRTRHPAIAAKTGWDPVRGAWIKEYRADTTGWAEETLVHVVGGDGDDDGEGEGTTTTGIEFANSDPPAPKMLTLFVVSPPREGEGGPIRRDLVLRSPHDIIDGVGTLHLLNNLAALLAGALSEEGLSLSSVLQGVPEDEVSRLSPAYRIAAAVPEEMNELTKRRLAEMDSVYAPPAGTTAEPIGLPYNRGALLPGKHQRVEIELSEGETAQVISAAKALGATVTHVFHAAIALVTRDRQVKTSEPRAVQYINYILRDERASCRPPYNSGTLYPAGVLHSVSSGRLVVDMTVPSETSTESDVEKKEAFLAAVKQMRDFYHGVRDDKEHYALVPYIFARSTPNLPAPTTTEAQNIPVPPPKELAPVSISSMGRIDAIMPPSYGPVELFSPWVTGEELGSGVGAFLGTFRGRLAFSAAYNDAWHDREGAEGFLRQCLEVVVDGLGLR